MQKAQSSREKRRKPKAKPFRKPKESFQKNRPVDEEELEDNQKSLKKKGKGVKVKDTPSKHLLPDDDDAHDDEVKKDYRAIWAKETMAKPSKTIHKEFIANKKLKPLDYTTEAYEANESKNRYNDIMCIDSTRVILKDRPSDDDYIHANWMTMPDGRKYISTQAPLSETTEDFWHMIFTEKSNVIVMLCSLVEGKSEKCARYYPNPYDKVETFGPFKVTIEDQKKDPFDSIKYQVLKVEKEGSSTALSVNHLMNPSWIDHVSPLDPAPTVGMLKLAKKLANTSPITVHCSAGIGRTGTFVGIDYASQKIEKSASINMIDILRDLRSMRFQSIQSVAQYKYLHICILELFAQEDVIKRNGGYAKYLAIYQNGVKRIMARLKKEEEK